VLIHVLTRRVLAPPSTPRAAPPPAQMGRAQRLPFWRFWRGVAHPVRPKSLARKRIGAASRLQVQQRAGRRRPAAAGQVGAVSRLRIVRADAATHPARPSQVH
jgi:hypothetical protein